jgi:hypothetical protein
VPAVFSSLDYVLKKMMHRLTERMKGCTNRGAKEQSDVKNMPDLRRKEVKRPAS